MSQSHSQTTTVKTHKYSHDKVYELCKERFDNMACFKKYKYYSQTFALPKFVRELGDEVLSKIDFTPTFTDNDGRIPTLSVECIAYV